jgi:hypothetical protein
VYYPASWQGWLCTLILSVLAVIIFTQIDTRSHSGSDTLINFAIPAIALMLLYDLLCFRTGEYPYWWRRKGESVK